MILLPRGHLFSKKIVEWKYEVGFLLTFPRMNTSEGQTGNLSLETVNPKSSESPSELQIEDQITTSREMKKIRTLSYWERRETTSTLQIHVSFSTVLKFQS